jgi:hypothetical protein
MNITKEILNDHYIYDDGHLFLKSNGKEVGCISPQGYTNIGFLKKTYRRHQLIFLLHNGYIPDRVDHIDGNKLNDKIENLRGCSHCENMRNRSIDKRNVTGFRGVSFAREQKKPYRAFISNGVKRLALGSFKTPEEASAAYESAAKLIFKEFYKSAVCAQACTL